MFELERFIEAWRIDCNSNRPHSALDYATPEDFASSHQGHAPGEMTKSARQGQTQAAELSGRMTSSGGHVSRTGPRAALRDMLDLTTADMRSEDIAAIVATAGRPGLKDRIIAYRDTAIGKKSKLRAPGE